MVWVLSKDKVRVRVQRFGAVLGAVCGCKANKQRLSAWFGVWFGAKLSKGAKLTSKG